MYYEYYGQYADDFAGYEDYYAVRGLEGLGRGGQVHGLRSVQHLGARQQQGLGAGPCP